MIILLGVSMNLETIPQNSEFRVSSIPRLIMLVGYLTKKRFGLLDQFLAFQCQANRFVTVIDNVSKAVRSIDEIFGCDYLISEINQVYLRCTLTGSLKKTVGEILKTYQSDCLIFEDKSHENLDQLIAAATGMEDLIRFDSVTVIIDCFTAERDLCNSDEMQKQIECADIILLDQKDLLDEICLQHLVGSIKLLNSNALIISLKSRTFNPALVYGINLMSYEDSFESSYYAVADQADPDSVCDCLKALRLRINHPINKMGFFKQIEALGENIFRIEGLISFSDEKLPVHLQYVGGRFDIRIYPNPNFKDPFMVLVVKNWKDELNLRF